MIPRIHVSKRGSILFYRNRLQPVIDGESIFSDLRLNFYLKESYMRNPVGKSIVSFFLLFLLFMLE